MQMESSDQISNLDLSAIPSGTYVLRIINNNMVTSHKLIKN
jgi:hypothetical protein